MYTFHVIEVVDKVDFGMVMMAIASRKDVSFHRLKCSGLWLPVFHFRVKLFVSLLFKIMIHLVLKKICYKFFFLFWISRLFSNPFIKYFNKSLKLKHSQIMNLNISLQYVSKKISTSPVGSFHYFKQPVNKANQD